MAAASLAGPGLRDPGGRDRPARQGREDAARQAARAEGNALLGMVLFIASWAILFAGLFFAYGAIRVRATVWPPADLPRLPLGLPGAATALIALSSAALQGAGKALRGGSARRAIGPLLAAGALGLAFLLLQALVWRQMWLAGLRPDTGTYASVFYGLTGFHALHVAVGLLALGWLSVATALGRYTARAHIPVRLWTLYWHMVGVLWAIMFVVVYLV